MLPTCASIEIYTPSLCFNQIRQNNLPAHRHFTPVSPFHARQLLVAQTPSRQQIVSDALRLVELGSYAALSARRVPCAQRTPVTPPSSQHSSSPSLSSHQRPSSP